MAFTKVAKPTVSWNKNIKPTADFSRTEKPYPLDQYLFQDGNYFIFQDGLVFVYEKSLAGDFTRIVKPT